MEKKQTAVEWFIEQLDKLEYEYDVEGISILDFDKRKIEIENQAKQMENNQHEETWFSSRVEDMGDEFKVEQKSFDDYYNETYGGNNSEITMSNQTSTLQYVCASCNKEMVEGGFPKWFCLHTTCKNYLKPITK